MGGLWHCYTHITGYSGDSCTPRWLLPWLLFISSSTQPGHVLGGERQGGPMCHHGPFNYHLHLQSELRLLWEKLVGWMCASLIAFVRFVGLSNNIHSHCICKVSLQDLVKMSDWWFGTCFIFPYIYIGYIGDHHPNWLSYFSAGSNHQPDVVKMLLRCAPTNPQVAAGQLRRRSSARDVGPKDSRQCGRRFGKLSKGYCTFW